MKILSVAAATAASMFLTVSAGIGAPAQIPTPANPFPENPVATDGTVLPPAYMFSGKPALVGDAPHARFEGDASRFGNAGAAPDGAYGDSWKKVFGF